MSWRVTRFIFPTSISLFFVGMFGLYINHLLTGQTVEPVLTHFQPLNLSIYWSTILIIAGIVIGGIAAERYGRKLHEDLSLTQDLNWNGNQVWQAIVPTVFWGIIGARVEVLLFPAPSLSQIGVSALRDFIEAPYLIISLTAGGLGMSGALIGGAFGLFLFCKRHELPYLFWLDIAVIGLAIGQSVGRWGDFFNQEFYGRYTTIPWAVTIDPISRLPEVVQFETFHPIFLYESIWTLIIFMVLVYLMNNRAYQLRLGQLASLYILLYSIGRVVFSLFRLNLPEVMLNASTIPVLAIFSAFVFLLAAVLTYRFYRLN